MLVVSHDVDNHQLFLFLDHDLACSQRQHGFQDGQVVL